MVVVLISPRFRYRIHGKESHKFPFHLEKVTGQLRVKGKLDRSQKARYEISVVAKLEGIEEKAFLDVFVDVLDANDNCPQFKNLPDSFQVRLKSKKANTEVYRITTEDADSGKNAQVSYKLIGVNSSDVFFSIDPWTGSVSSPYTYRSSMFVSR